MAFYVKVTTQVATKLGHTTDRNSTADDNKLLWQADLNEIEGETIFDRAAKVGGVCLTSQEAKAEIDGCENPAKVYTPEEYMDPEPTPEPPTEEPQPEETPTEQPVETEPAVKEEGGNV